MRRRGLGRRADARGSVISNIERLLQTATDLHRAGDLAAAQRLYARVLAEQPAHHVALFRSGLIDLQERRLEAARAAIERAVAAAPGESRYRFGLGQVLEAQGLLEPAAGQYREVLRLEPASRDAHLQLGAALQRAGRPDAAAEAYRGALALDPQDPVALGNLGAVLRETGRLEESEKLLRAALALEPRAAAHAINLAITLHQRRDFAAAADLLGEVLAREPGNADAAFNLGNALRAQGRTRDSLEPYRRAAAARPGFSEALVNLGNAHRELGEHGAALASFEAALQAAPNHVAALNNAACVLRTLGRLDEAEDILRRALDVAPEHAALHDNLGNVLKDAGALDAAIECFRRSLALDPANAPAHGNLAYALSFLSETPEPVLAECRRWAARFAAPLERLPADAGRDLAPQRRLNVGYVSADFREHCQTLFTLPLLRRHDHARFRIFCYSSVERPDEYTARIARHADVWREVRALDDAELAHAIRADGIDVLVDLTMHMAGGRPLVFARKPAPVQIAWLAYPGTTGMEAVDYRLSDARLDPEGFESHYVERTLHLADSFWCYDPLATDPPVGPLPALESGRLTLGCLNNPCKLTDRTLDLWGAVLRALPAAHLLLMAPEGRHRARLIARLGARGVAAQRLEFVAFRPRAEYLGTYRRIDFALDTFPYNGHTTSLDALFMGVPTVTRVGGTCVGRGGLSQLHQLGLTRLAAHSDEEFAAIAAALAADLPALAALRGSLRARLERSRLMDDARFAHSIEDAYRSAWLDHVRAAGRAPRSERR